MPCPRTDLSLAGAPLFLIVGSAGPRQEGAIMRAAGLSLRVHDLPEGPAPLHWYASPDGIYLIISETCGLSSLAALLEKRRAAAMSLGETGTPADLPALPAPAAPAETDHGTIKPGQMRGPAAGGGRLERHDHARSVRRRAARGGNARQLGRGGSRRRSRCRDRGPHERSAGDSFAAGIGAATRAAGVCLPAHPAGPFSGVPDQRRAGAAAV